MCGRMHTSPATRNVRSSREMGGRSLPRAAASALGVCGCDFSSSAMRRLNSRSAPDFSSIPAEKISFSGVTDLTELFAEIAEGCRKPEDKPDDRHLGWLLTFVGQRLA